MIKIRPNYKWRIRSFLMGFALATAIFLGINAISPSRATESPAITQIKHVCSDDMIGQVIQDRLVIALDGGHATIVKPERKPR